MRIPFHGSYIYDHEGFTRDCPPDGISLERAYELCNLHPQMPSMTIHEFDRQFVNKCWMVVLRDDRGYGVVYRHDSCWRFMRGTESVVVNALKGIKGLMTTEEVLKYVGVEDHD